MDKRRSNSDPIYKAILWPEIINNLYPNDSEDTREVAAVLLADGWHGSLQELIEAARNLTKESKDE